MAIVVVLFADVVSKVSMPALAGLLIVIGVGTIKPAQIMAVLKTGKVQIVVMSLTFGLTLVIPVQFAVLAGVALAVLLYVVRQSNSITLRALEIDDAGRAKEVDPPPQLPPGTVVVLQPYGSLFFASAPSLQKQLPEVAESSANSVVILRLRGVDELGVTQIGVVRGYGESLAAAGSKLVVVATSDRLLRQIRRSGLADELGPENIYRGTEWVGETVIRAQRDAQAWVAERTGGSQGSAPGEFKRI
jgi:SulP family sulfate permease